MSTSPGYLMKQRENETALIGRVWAGSGPWLRKCEGGLDEI